MFDPKLRACRACLTTTGKLEVIGANSRRLYTAITGLKMEPDDGYPTFFCQECRSHIRRSFQFRRKALRAYYVFKEMITVKGKVQPEDMQLVDRKKTNLESPYGTDTTNSKLFWVKTDGVDDDATTQVQSTEVPTEGPAEGPAYKFDVLRTDASTTGHNFAIQVTDLNNLSTAIQASLNDGTNESAENQHGLQLVNPECEGNAKIWINIRPANWREIEEEEKRRKEEERQREIQSCLEEIRDDDDGVDDVEELPPDFDPEDVFKGLEEKQVDSELESLPDTDVGIGVNDLTKTLIDAEKKRKKNKKPDVANNPAEIMSLALPAFKIRVLKTREQKKVFADRVKRLVSEVANRFKCTLCMKSFNYANDLVAHAKTHQAEISYEHKCQVCQRKFNTAELLTSHQARNHWYEVECNTCVKKYHIVELDQDMIDLCYLQHIKYASRMFDRFADIFIKVPLQPKAIYRTMDNYTGRMILAKHKCEQCNIGLENAKEMKRHMLLHEGPKEGPAFECDVCHLKFRKINKLSRHMKSWHMFWYSCTTCNAVLMNQTQALNHKEGNWCVYYQHSYNCRLKKKYNCVFCGLPVKYPMACSNNWEHFEAAFDPSWSCLDCGKTIFPLGRLYHHQLTEHNYINHQSQVAPQYCCSDCGVHFANENAYITHVVTTNHAQGEEFDIACRTCRSVFESPEHCRAHKCMALDKAKQRIECLTCSGVASDPYAFRVHLKYFHDASLTLKQLTEEEPTNTSSSASRYKLCDECGRMINRCILDRHIQAHRKPKPEPPQCHYCEQKFVNYTAAIHHILNIHSVKPFMCALCPTRFKYRSETRDHILKVHAPVQLYYCSLCDRRFAHLDYLNDHSKKMHNVDVKKDPSVFIQRSNLKIRRVALYPHMKIDVTLIDASYVEQAEILRCDYMEENHEKIENLMDHLYIGDINEAVIMNRDKQVIKRKYAVKYDENNQPIPKKYVRKSKHNRKSTGKSGDNTANDSKNDDDAVGLSIVSNELIEDTKKKSKSKKSVNTDTETVKSLSGTKMATYKSRKRRKTTDNLSDAIEAQARKIEESLMNTSEIKVKEEIEMPRSSLSENFKTNGTNKVKDDFDKKFRAKDEKLGVKIEEKVLVEAIDESLFEEATAVTNAEDVKVDEPIQMEMNLEDLQHYEIVTLEGQEYIMMDDVLYKIERQ